MQYRFQHTSPNTNLSVEARRLVCKLAHIKNPEQFIQDSLVDRTIKANGFYWSVSHKPEYVAAAISSVPIGVDIELNVSRSHELLKTFSVPDWKTFYRHWVCKEALIKLLQLTIHDMPRIQIEHEEENSVLVSYQQNHYTCLVEQNETITLAVVEQNTQNQNLVPDGDQSHG